MERPHSRKRPFSGTQEFSTQEKRVCKPTTVDKSSPSSRLRKFPRHSERGFRSTSTEQTSHSSSYRAAPERRWVRCAYFTKVRTVSGVAVAWRTPTSVDKMPQIFEAELSEESTIGSAPSLANTQSLVSTLEPWQQGSESHTPESSVQGEGDVERSVAATPEWMLTCKRGFRCMACCRVFESRDALVAHAERGVTQGFSCRLFFEELLEKRLPPSVPRRPRRCHQLARRHLLAAKGREVRVKAAACRRLEEQLEKEREELKRLKQELRRLQRQEAWLQKEAQHVGQWGTRLRTPST